MKTVPHLVPVARPRGRGHLAVAACLLAALTAGASRAVAGEPGPVPAMPGQALADIPKPARPATTTARGLPENWREIAASLTLADIVDVALANNEDTRGAWFAARSAAADLGSKRSEYFPTATLETDLSRVKVAAVGGRFTFQQSSWGPALNLTGLLFDFGGRSARVEQARAALLAADWQHNAAIQDVILEVQRAFFSYLDTRAQLAAAEVNLADLQRNLDAASARHEVGLATVADVLQAKTAHSQALLVRQQLEGSVETLRGSLATAMGIPATTPFDVVSLPDTVEAPTLEAEIEPLIERAVANRPDLVAARWRTEKAVAKIRDVRSEGLPSLTASANGQRVYYITPESGHSDNWSLGLNLRVPLFAGFQHHYDRQKAEADAEATRSTETRLEQQVVLEVWTAYTGLKTAAQQLETARDLLASAEQSTEVARGRYNEGVGSILDLLTAQSSLAEARAVDIRARTNWLLAVAELAHATGGLEPAEADQADDGQRSTEN